MTIATPNAPVKPARAGTARIAKLEADRLRRVIELRTAILEGTYEVPAEAVADAVIAAHV